MYQCAIPPRLFLAVGVGLLIFSLVLGWISFSVPDWLQFYEPNLPANTTLRNNQSDLLLTDEKISDLKKFGLWYKCTFSSTSNDFLCTLWNKDAPSFVQVAQVLIPMGLSLGCLSFLLAIIGFMSRRAFITSVLFAALFAFLSFVFTTIGVTVFATESLVYVERLRLTNNENPRRWGMWLIIPSLILSFLASLCFILASVFNWCDYRSMQVTGILSHSVDKYGGSVFKAPSDSSNTTSAIKKQHPYLHQQTIAGQDYTNACYQINGQNANQNPLGYPPPPSYAGPMHQQGSAGGMNQGFPPNSAPFGYSRPGSPTMNPMYPHSNFDPYHPRNYMTENSEMDDFSGMNRSRRRSRSRRHSGHRSRSHSPRDNQSAGNNTQDNAAKHTQFIPIPVPYYQPQPPPAAPAPTAVPNNTNASNQPIPYMIHQPKPQFIEEFIQPTAKPTNIVTYNTGQPSMMVSNATQPVYTIAYRTNNGGSVLASNILTGPAAATYVTATRTPMHQQQSSAEIYSFQNDSDLEENDYRTMSKPRRLKKINANAAWAWRKL